MSGRVRYGTTFNELGSDLASFTRDGGRHHGSPARRPNILVIFGDDIGQTNISAYGIGVVGYMTPNIDRIANEGMMFTDYYAENSCTAGRSTFITGQTPKRTGLSRSASRARRSACRTRDITIAQAMKPLGYATGQFGKNHLGDRNEYLPTVTASTSSSATSTT